VDLDLGGLLAMMVGAAAGVTIVLGVVSLIGTRARARRRS